MKVFTAICQKDGQKCVKIIEAHFDFHAHAKLVMAGYSILEMDNGVPAPQQVFVGAGVKLTETPFGQSAYFSEFLQYLNIQGYEGM